MLVKTWAFLLMMSVCCTATAQLGPIQSLQSIQAAAEAFVTNRLPPSKARYFTSAGSLDSRLRLAQCDTPLETFASSNTAIGARTTVGVRCTSPSPWTLYVPVAVEVETQVLVLRRGLPRRAPILAEDVELQTRRMSGALTNFITDASALQGHRLKRALPAGTPLTIEVLAPDLLIRRGQKVMLVAASGGIEIRAEGLALTEGALNDRVRVQNANSSRIVEGVVTGAGTVRVDL